MLCNNQRQLEKNHNCSKCKIMEPRHTRFIYNTTPAYKAQGLLKKWGLKDCRVRGSRNFLRLCLLEILEAITRKSQQKDCLEKTQRTSVN